MNDIHDQSAAARTPESSETADTTALRGSHQGLLLTTAILLTTIALLAGGFGVSAKLPSLVVLSLQTLLAGATCWMVINAQRLRVQWSEARHMVREQAKPREKRASGGWLGGDRQEDEQTFHAVLGDVEHARRLHWVFVALLPLVLAGGLIAWAVFGGERPETIEVVTARAGALALLGLALSTVWLVLARSLLAIQREELPEASMLGLTLRESQWATLLLSLALLSRLVYPPAAWWIGRALLIWLLLVVIEQLGRVLWLWWDSRSPRASAAEAETARRFLPPLELLSRELLLIRANPVASLFETIENRWGVSFRSSWAIRFVRAATLPTILMALLLFWALSCLSMVGPSELGVRITLGQMEHQPLKPGLHWKLPWPLGRIDRHDVKRVRSQPLGFVEMDRPVAVLWTNEHAKEEFALLLGDGTEALAVNSVVYYKIREDREGFFNYVLNFKNPAEALEGFGYRALMQQTRSSTLDNVLATNRARFADDLEQSLQQYAEQNELGIEVVEVALVSLHPPVDAAEDYLQVISARIDADRYQIEAAGERLVQIEDAEANRARAVADAKVEAARRVSTAIEESSEFTAVGEAYQVAPESFEFRLRGDVFEEVLKDKPLVVVDKSFSIDPSGIYYDYRRDKNQKNQQ